MIFNNKSNTDNKQLHFHLKERLFAKIYQMFGIIPEKLNWTRQTYAGEDKEITITPIISIVGFSVNNANTNENFTITRDDLDAVLALNSKVQEGI